MITLLTVALILFIFNFSISLLSNLYYLFSLVAHKKQMERNEKQQQEFLKMLEHSQDKFTSPLTKEALNGLYGKAGRKDIH